MAQRDYFWDRSGRRIRRAPRVIPSPPDTDTGGGRVPSVPPVPTVSDGLWELVGTQLQPLQSLIDTDDIQSLLVEIERAQVSGGGGALHHTSLLVAPGIGGGGGDIQAETYITGQDALMDWFFWSRPSGGGSTEAGSFWDAIGDDGVGTTPEAFFEVYANGSLAVIESSVDLGNGSSKSAEFDVVGDPDNDLAYYHFYGTGSFLKFGRTSAAASFDVAPDAALAVSGNWSVGYDGADIIFKVNDSGTIKTWTATPT